MPNLKLIPTAILKAELGKRNFTGFLQATFQGFTPTEFHINLSKALDKFARGEIKNMMIFVPPQHGKSEQSTRRLPAYLLGHNPDLKIAVVSYNSPMARKFNREIQRVIDDDVYANIFPKTRLNGSNVATLSGGWLRNADECEIVGHRGGFKTVGVGGPLTGSPVDVLIMDDLYKDAQSAWSATTRANIQDWYDSVASTRLHNTSRQLIVFTRWHHEDLAGILLKKQPDKWVVIEYPAIMNRDKSIYDTREMGEALWPERHSLEKLIEARDSNPHVFESLYQQNPKPLEGLLYTNLKTYSELPQLDRLFAYIDTADTGGDYLCCVVFGVRNELRYIVDVVYSNKKAELTEPMVSECLKRNNVQVAHVESNAGGRAFSRNIERIMNESGYYGCQVKPFHQSANKESRILSNASTLQNCVIFPDDWHIRWNDYYLAMVGYTASGKNAHDDAPDATTGILEVNKFSKQSIIW